MMMMMLHTECKRLRRPYQGSIRCVSGTRHDNGVTTTCTIACQDGFAFSGAVLAQYECGPDTGYLWPHESPDNPRALLPACTGRPNTYLAIARIILCILSILTRFLPRDASTERGNATVSRPSVCLSVRDV